MVLRFETEGVVWVGVEWTGGGVGGVGGGDEVEVAGGEPELRVRLGVVSLVISI